MSEQTAQFFRHLAKRCNTDRAAVACLRRSLSFPPGEWPRAFPYIEPLVSGAGGWRRRMFYLAAGLWASANERNGSTSFGEAVGEYMRQTRSESIEKRFIALLESDTEQCPHRLRRMCDLLKDVPVDFASLLDGLLLWNLPGKKVQWRWAKDFYAVPADVAAMAGAESDA